LRGIIPQIHDAGAELVVVGNGTAQQALWFREATGLTTPVYTDPDLHLYRALGARRGWRAFAHPMVFVRGLQALWGGSRQSGLMGDATQIGALAIVRRDGSIPYLHRSAYAGDTPKPAAILSALHESEKNGPRAVVR
jgi:hypothetical protein